MTDKLTATLLIAERACSLAQAQEQELEDPALMIWAYNVLASTLYYLGDFKSARQYAMHGVQIWRSRGGQSYPEDLDPPVVGCLCYEAFSEWHLGEIASCFGRFDLSDP